MGGRSKEGMSKEEASLRTRWHVEGKRQSDKKEKVAGQRKANVGDRGKRTRSVRGKRKATFPVEKVLPLPEKGRGYEVKKLQESAARRPTRSAGTSLNSSEERNPR